MDAPADGSPSRAGLLTGCYPRRVGLATWVLGLGTVFSFNIWSDAKLFGKTVFDMLDYLTANIMLPLGGLLIAIFAGWMMRSESSKAELNTTEGGYNAWIILIRYITPLLVMAVFAKVTGLI